MSEITAIHPLLQNPPRWWLMWLLAGALFFIGKAAIAWPLRRRLGWAGTAAYSFLWVGMDARPFIAKAKEPGQPAPAEPPLAGTGCPGSLMAALARIVSGLLLLYVVARHFSHPLAQGWCGMVGLILVLHFGVFSALAAAWQLLGVRVRPIMDRPTAAISLAEFWGRRWNIAFRDLAHPFVFRPVARRWGLSAALWLSFAVSGVAHDLVISVPAGAGFGLPTAYFLLQAFGVTLERRLFGNVAAASHRTERWFFTHAFTVLPVFLLFHPPFVERVMVPFFHAIGALP